MRCFTFLSICIVHIFIITSCVKPTEPPDSSFNEEGLIAYYPFNGTVKDESGNTNHGILRGAVFTEDRFGNLNKAIYFDGINDYIDIGNQESLKTDLPFTIAAWINLSERAYFPPIFLNNYTENFYYGIIFNVVEDNYLCINICNGDSLGPTSRKTKRGITSLRFFEWYHVAAVVKSAQNMELFINGKIEPGLYSGSGGDLNYNTDSGVLGVSDGSIHDGKLYYYGKMDEIRFYNRALTDEEIDLLFKHL